MSPPEVASCGIPKPFKISNIEEILWPTGCSFHLNEHMDGNERHRHTARMLDNSMSIDAIEVI